MRGAQSRRHHVRGFLLIVGVGTLAAVALAAAAFGMAVMAWTS